MRKPLHYYLLPMFLAIGIPVFSYGQISVSGDLSGIKRTEKENVYDTAQYKVFYEITIAEESGKPTSVKAGQGVLLISHKAVSFEDYSKYRTDSLLNAPASSERSTGELMNAALSFPKSLFKYKVIVLPDENKALHQTSEVAFSVYRYEEEKPAISWTKATDTKEIAGFHCHRATCSFRGRYYEAWYTDELPFPYGPYTFGGLPGLIMELSDSKGDYHYTFAGIEEIKQPHEGRIRLYAGSRLQILTRKEVRQIVQNYYKDPRKLIEDKVKVDDSESLPKKKYSYNPIELE